MSQVVLEHITKFFVGPKGTRIQAVQDLSLTIDAGEFFVIAGPSGCGKTTLLRLIAGLETPEAGGISFGNRMATQLPPQERDVAMVFQQYALYPHMTAAQNIGFGLHLRKKSRTEIETRVLELGDLLGIRDCLSRLPSELSGGERQRVALARALARQPGILLLDEPLSNLDPPLRHRLRSDILKLKTSLHVTIIYVTHDHLDAMAMGDRAAILNNGILQQVAAPLELYQTPANLFVAAFFGAPPMNLFHGMLEIADGNLRFREKEAPPPDSAERLLLSLDQTKQLTLHQLVGKPIVLGIRAEHIKLHPSERKPECLGSTIDFVEHTGAEAIVHAKTASHNFVFKAPATFQACSGQTIHVTFDPASLSFFDSTSGLRINC